MAGLKNRWKDYILPLFLFFSTFLIYLHNLSPSVFGGDVGDFVTAVVVKGVPHASGYPLFTILGIIFNSLPLAATPAWRVGLISVLFSSFSVVLLYLISYKLTKTKLVSLITSLTLAFFYIFWLYAEVAEVFALTNFFILLLILLALSYYKEKNPRYIYFLAFFAGLSLSNHEIILAVFPSLAVLVMAKDWRILLKPVTLAKCGFLFLLGLTPYIYIPIAAFHNPPVNWDNASNLHNFIQLVLRKDYGWGASPGFDFLTRFLALKTYFVDIVTELTPAGFVTAFLGMIYTIKTRKFAVFASIFLGFLFIGPIYVLYGFVPILSGFILGVLQRFYMLSALFLLIFFPFGVLFITELITPLLKKIKIPAPRIKIYISMFSLLFIIIPISLFFYNFSKTDLHNVWVGDYLAKDILAPLPKNSILLIQGDTGFFNVEYMQFAMGFRKDVTVINLGTLSVNTLVQAAKSNVSGNSKLPEDVLDIKSILSVAKNSQIFSTHNLEYKDKKYGKLNWQPYGLLYELIGSNKGVQKKEEFLKEQQSIWKKLHTPSVNTNDNSPTHSLTLSDITSIYSQGLIRLGNYLITNYSDFERAKVYYEIAVAIDPGVSDARTGLGYYYLNKNDCNNAVKNFRNAIILDPSQKNSYVLLYGTYLICSKDKKSANQVAQEYKNLFNSSIINEFNNQLYKSN